MTRWLVSKRFQKHYGKLVGWGNQGRASVEIENRSGDKQLTEFLLLTELKRNTHP